MKKMVICWILLIGGLVGVLTFIGLTYEKSVSLYKSLEADLVESADAYVNITKIDLAIDESLIITDEKLREDNLIGSMSVESDTCEGYVEIKKNINKTNYKAYINCKEYQTEGYKKQK